MEVRPSPKRRTKDEEFRRLENGKFECLMCFRILSSKERILYHLNSIHNLSPVKRQKKKYIEDESVAVPQRTLRRWKQNQTLSMQATGISEGEFERRLSSTSTNSSREENTMDNDAFEDEPTPSDDGINSSGIFPLTSELSEGSYYQLDDIPLDGELSDVDLSQTDSSDDSCSGITDSCSSLEDSFENSEHSIFGLTDEDSVSLNDFLHETNRRDTQFKTEMLEKESQALTILSCFTRNNLPASTSKDILNTMKGLFSSSQNEDMFNLDHLYSYVSTTEVNEIHYCIICNKVYPKDKDIVECATNNCDGLRYKGTPFHQHQKQRQPRQCFVMADTEKQLKDLLQTPGIWKDIQDGKKRVMDRLGSTIITDITDGSQYRSMISEGGFLDPKCHNLTATCNTDGVNLYSSSKVELWPIFLAINELNPTMRFSRDNMLLAGIWQGKGKPPFKQFMEVFSTVMNGLFENGANITIESGEEINVKLSVVAITADLPAKASLLNMTFYNGAESCISCMDPGLTVKQGKGTARCFPYREEGSRFQQRNHDMVIEQMERGTVKNRCHGMKGLSGIAQLKSFDIVLGTVPDYMHGVMLGITKTLLNKWFSPSESKKSYFAGNKIKEISKRLQNIKPPDSIERLPRDLEKHHSHFKATELQAWLLYYSLPCMDGFLDEEYMENLRCLSEAIYILLGDCISTSALDRADMLLKRFHASFQSLYGDGSCGLNVHNAGTHYVQYVKLWGPLWGWSCFPFEDTNAMLLQAVHGTGIVLKQIMKFRQVQASIRCKGLHGKKSNSWKIKHSAINCDVAGAMKKLQGNELDQNILNALGGDVGEMKKCDRILVNGSKFYSSQYSRMQKRVCNVVLYEQHKIGSIQFFVLLGESVHAIIDKFDQRADEPNAGRHLVEVTKTSDVDIVDAEELLSTLVYVNTGENQKCYVVKIPNRHGHAVFK